MFLAILGSAFIPAEMAPLRGLTVAFELPTRLQRPSRISTRPIHSLS